MLNIGDERLLEATLIPVGEAQIEWGEDDMGCVDDVVVFDRRTSAEGDALRPNSSGACGLHWMEDGYPQLTPEGLYAERVRAGFTNDEEHELALSELARIDGCDWARRIVQALGRLGPRGVEDGIDRFCYVASVSV